MKKVVILCILLLIGSIGFVSAEDISDTSNINLNTHDSYIIGSGNYNSTLTYTNGTPISNQEISYLINNDTFNVTTDVNGISTIPINLCSGNYIVKTSLINYPEVFNTNIIYVRDVPTVFIESGLTNIEIQSILDNAEDGSNIEFLGNYYDDISLNITQKTLNLFSYCGSVLSGTKNPILTISSYKSVVSGLKFVNSDVGVYVFNSNELQIMNNTFNSNIDAIVLKNSKNTIISNNTITQCVNGIYFDSGNYNTKIFNNQFYSNTNYTINLDKSGSNSDIYQNSFLNNVNGININCDGTNLNIFENTFQWNQEVAIQINEGYRRNNDNDILNVENNAFLYNYGFNARASKSIYDIVNLGTNFVGANSGYDIRTCPKAKLGVYQFSINQNSPSSLQYSVLDSNGNVVTSMGTFNLRVSQNGGTGYSLVSVTNGVGTIYVTNQNGDVVIDGGEYGSINYNLVNYVPYTPSIQEDSPVNQTTTNANGASGSATQSGSGSNSLGVSSANGLAAGATSVSATSAGATSAGASSSSSSNQAIAKILNLDDEFVQISGVTGLILLMIIVIGLYYRNDIRIMLNRRKEHQF